MRFEYYWADVLFKSAAAEAKKSEQTEKQRCPTGETTGCVDCRAGLLEPEIPICEPHHQTYANWDEEVLATGRRGIAAVAECTNVNLKLGGIGMPDVTAWFFETMLGAEVTRSVYPPGTLYPGQQRITMRLGGHKVLIAPPHPHELNVSAPQSPSLRAGAIG